MMFYRAKETPPEDANVTFGQEDLVTLTVAVAINLFY